MRKLIAFLLAFAAVFSFAGCQKTMKGTDALIEKARKEIPISDADTIDMRCAGMSVKGDDALIWFISGNEYQAHYYLPMECKVVGENEYSFTRTYKPIDSGCVDIAALHWKDGYSFLINNPNCTALKIEDASGSREVNIETNAYPYVIYNELTPSEYLFLDAQGNELP